MAISEFLEIPQTSESQSLKATSLNIAVELLAQSMSDIYSLDASAAVSLGDDIVLPYDDSDDLSDRTALRFVYLDIVGTPATGFDVIHPDSKHLFFVKNSTTKTASIKTLTGSLSVTLAAGQGQIVYCNGDECVALLAGGGTIQQAIDYEVNYYGNPSASEVIAQYLTSRQVDFPANFLGSAGYVTTEGRPTAATYVFQVFDNATLLGTVTVNNGGTFSFATVSGTAKTVTAGRRITVVASATTDTTLRDFQFTLLGKMTVTQ